MPPGLHLHLQQVVVIQAQQQAVAQAGFAGAGLGLVAQIALVLPGVAGQVMHQGVLVARRAGLHHGPVLLGHPALTEQLGQALQGLGGAGEQHHPAGGPVQAVRDPDEHAARLGVLGLQVFLELLGEGLVPGLVPLHDVRGPFVHGDQVVVLVQDLQVGCGHRALCAGPGPAEKLPLPRLRTRRPGPG